MEVFYICDRKACEDHCSYPLCKHTTDVTHAANFVPETRYDGEPLYIEKEDMTVDELYTKLSKLLQGDEYTDVS